jgi:hypothetical protein
MTWTDGERASAPIGHTFVGLATVAVTKPAFWIAEPDRPRSGVKWDSTLDMQRNPRAPEASSSAAQTACASR